MTLSTDEIYRQKESSSLTQTAKFIFSRLFANCEVFELGDLLNDIKTGKTPSKNEKKYYEDEFIDWFKPNEIGDKKYLEKAESKLSKFAYDKGQVTVYKANSILINAIGDVGRIAILNHEASSNQQITGIELNEEKLLTEYCYYYLLANRHHFYKDLFQTTLPIVNQKKIKLIPIPVPELNEQKRIVAFLNYLENVNSLEELKDIIGFDEFIEIAEKFFILKNKSGEISTELTHQLDLVKQLRQAFLREAMQGKLVPQDENDEPASVLLEEIKAEKERLIKKKKLKRGKASSQTVSKVDEWSIPSAWVTAKTDDIFFVTKLAGFEYTKHINLKETGEIPVIRAQNVRPFIIDKTNLLFIDEEISLLLDRCALTKESLLVTFIGAGIGDVARFCESERWHLAPNVAKLEPFEGCEAFYNLKYLNYFLSSPDGREEIFKHVKATAQPSLSMGTIRDIDVPLPPLSEQHRIVAKLDELMGYCDELEASIKESQQQNEQLLQQVLREALEPKEKEVQKV